VASDNSPGQILQYSLPITSASVPALSLVNAATPSLVALALDSSGNLATGDNAGNLAFYAGPVTGSTSVSATFKNGTATNDGQLFFNSAGDLFAPTTGNKVNVFTHPLTSSSTPFLVVTDPGLTSSTGALLDSGGNLIIANNPGSTSNLLVFPTPSSGATVTTPAQASSAYRKMAVSGSQLFVTNVAGTLGRIDVYNLPLTSSSGPAFSITSGINTPEAIAFDASGNMYIGNLTDASITVFVPPFSAASTSTVKLTVSTGAFSLFGIAIGK